MSPDSNFKSPLLILGGAKSGKSAYAEAILNRFSPPYVYIATAQVLDDEMKERVNAHRERRKNLWETIECPLLLPELLKEVCGMGRPVLIDCITLWLSNLLCFSSIDPETAVEELCSSISATTCPLVIVSNEVGGGIVPENALARKFRDVAGSTNQRLARTCASVSLVVAGLPLQLK
jgi:adenosylcobinamide kinase / adenosylcobinamide-phosphate guanylyltransferase